jgi:nitrite reductase (NADH) large subunit
LVLATGSSAFVPPIKGVEKEGVFVYRTIEDLEDMLGLCGKNKS